MQVVFDGLHRPCVSKEKWGRLAILSQNFPLIMCKYYSSYMVIIYALSKQASKQHMKDDDVSK